MLLLLDKEVAGESCFSLRARSRRPRFRRAHPFRVARFTNQTGGLLERGPLAFFGEGGFLGQGVIDGLPAGASATVPFALEQSLAIERNTEYIQEGSTLHQIEMGQLIVKRQVGPRTRYTIKSGNARGAKLWIKHPRQSGSKLAQSTEGHGRQSRHCQRARARPDRPAGHCHDRPRRTARTADDVDWLSPLAEEAVKGYLDAPDADKSSAAALKTAFDLRNEWKKFSDETRRLRTEQEDLERSTEETRDNSRPSRRTRPRRICARPSPHRLSKTSSRLDVVVKRLIEVDLQVKELELRFVRPSRKCTSPRDRSHA